CLFRTLIAIGEVDLRPPSETDFNGWLQCRPGTIERKSAQKRRAGHPSTISAFRLQDPTTTFWTTAHRAAAAFHYETKTSWRLRLLPGKNFCCSETQLVLSIEPSNYPTSSQRSATFQAPARWVCLDFFITRLNICKFLPRDRC